ncbi:hypothetical protein B7R54_09965 [Subtercola boreus]|uniref:N-acetyltransferase domain-containing protein n=1 Tax=Subtercola boreus TaxID=120213 RepID=A0A3E0VJE3_9MICO|nr:GNAT family N-acetyltransferase [Subtercola boreus]RFA09510.1 hypothetical protein B7R54_09965 [Subtercola boreus]TQL53429.1 ribosomal protein S18 acetylase RimI-like enzyme [Subtercola boreus]
MHVVECPVSDPDARLLLEHYFASRADGFPPERGTYRVTFPDPALFLPPEGVFLLLRGDDDGPVGCGGIRRQDDTTFEVKHVWLEPPARGQGWAGILMQRLEDRARDFGATAVVLDTNASLLGAAKLYARRGYENIPAYNDNPNATNWYRKALG